MIHSGDSQLDNGILWVMVHVGTYGNELAKEKE
jgi:hypothetical protein